MNDSKKGTSSNFLSVENNRTFNQKLSISSILQTEILDFSDSNQKTETFSSYNNSFSLNKFGDNESIQIENPIKRPKYKLAIDLIDYFNIDENQKFYQEQDKLRKKLGEYYAQNRHCNCEESIDFDLKTKDLNYSQEIIFYFILFLSTICLSILLNFLQTFFNS